MRSHVWIPTKAMQPKVVFFVTNLFLILNFVLSTNANNEVIIETGVKLYGSEMTTLTGRKFLAFRGIPYAEPPIGNLRFRAPVTKRWGLKEYNATDDGPICVQTSLKTNAILGKEDCLILNVYTQNVSFPLSKVMFFIHGGGFIHSTGASTAFGPRRLLDRNVVLVTINYRLGPFGFLSTLNEACPGNFGLLDQVEALKWVQRNIAAFGGDSSKVTIFGQSIGSSCVLHHLISPISKGLFQRAIAQSGSPSWGEQKNAPNITKTLADEVGCLNSNPEKMVDCFRSAPIDKIFKSSVVNSSVISFGPVGDGYFLSDFPTNLLKQGKVANKNTPLMIGTTKDEGLTFLIFSLKARTMEYSYDFLVNLVSSALNIDSTLLNNETIDLIRKQYSISSDLNKDELISHASNMLGDGIVNAPTHETIVELISHGVKPFVYRYDYLSNKTTVLDGVKGVGHADDLNFLFDMPGNFSTVPNDEFENMFLDIWTNFAEYGYLLMEFELKRATKSTEIVVNRLNKRISTFKYQPKKDWRLKFWLKTVADTINKNDELK